MVGAVQVGSEAASSPLAGAGAFEGGSRVLNGTHKVATAGASSGKAPRSRTQLMPLPINQPAVTQSLLQQHQKTSRWRIVRILSGLQKIYRLRIQAETGSEKMTRRRRPAGRLRRGRNHRHLISLVSA